MIRTLFGFENTLKSNDLNLLASLRGGVGVINGFSKGLIEGNRLEIGLRNSTLRNNIYQPSWDNIEDPIPFVTHSCIARDGSIYVSSDAYLKVEPILGSKHKLTEVLLFAVHQPVNDPVVNPVTLVAYWNPTTISLAEIYKQYTNPSTVGDIYKLSTRSFDTILSGLSFYNKETMVLIGVYGKVLNTDTKVFEDFSLPISDNFPSVLPETDAINNLLETLIIHKTEYEKSVGDLYDKLTTLTLDFENINRRLDEVTRRLGLVESKIKES